MTNKDIDFFAEHR